MLPFCGGNIDPGILNRVIEKGLVADGRLCRFTAVINDRPGGLAALTGVLAEVGASVKEIVHDCTFNPTEISAVQVVYVVETRDRVRAGAMRLIKHGFPYILQSSGPGRTGALGGNLGRQC